MDVVRGYYMYTYNVFDLGTWSDKLSLTQAILQHMNCN